MADQLVPFAESAHLPAPADLKDQLRTRMAELVAAVRAERGPVHLPEDVNDLVRKLAGAMDILGEYANAFSSAAKLAEKELGNELIEAVGESDGIPLASLTVPDLNGTDIRLLVKFANEHAIDLQSVLGTVVQSVLRETDGTEPEFDEITTDETWEEYRARYDLWLAGVLRLGIVRMLELGSFSLQVSKVRAFQASLAGLGEDQMAGVLRSAVVTKQKSNGMKVERQRRKERQ